MGKARVEMIPFRNFKEKIRITIKYDRLAKMQIIEDKYVYLEWRIWFINMDTD